MSVATFGDHLAQDPVLVASRREKVILSALLVFAGLTYIWALDQNGWANAYYAGAVQAGQHDLKAFIFASADWGNAVTVDKPPLSLWLMGLSVRLFGMNSWALLIPQALITLSSSLLTYRLVRRCFPFACALIAAAVFSFTPITVLLARYNNPDPLMVLLMTAALYAGIRATESGKFRYFILVATLLSLGFLTKQLQAFLVLPALIVTVLLFSRTSWPRRFVTVGAMSGVLCLGSVAWPLYIDLMPKSDRPYIGGSTTNSMLELTLGYNGLDRVLRQGDAPSTSLVPSQYRSVDTDAGIFRLLNLNYGQEIGWLLLPAVLSTITAILLLLRRDFDRRQSILVCAAATWMITTFLTLSFMGNNFHSYYTASLALPLALCIGVGSHLLKKELTSSFGRVFAAASVIASSVVSKAVWGTSSAYPEWLGNAALAAAICAAAVLSIRPPNEWILRFAMGVTAAALFAGPLACSLLTAATPQEGSNPLSGGVTDNPNTLSRFLDGVKRKDPKWAAGIAIGAKPSQGMSALLNATSTSCRWVAATYPGQTAAQFQLRVGRPVMSLGGFAGIDPNPTLQQFQEWTASGDICFLVEQPEHLKVPGNSTELTAISTWVKNNFKAEKIDGVTVYDLTK